MQFVCDAASDYRIKGKRKMARRPTQTEVTRAVTGAIAAGWVVAEVLVDGETVRILTTAAQKSPSPAHGQALDAAAVARARLDAMADETR